MTLHFTTTSRAHYEVRENGEYRHVRRLGDESDTQKRADGEWLCLYASHPQEPVVGQRISLIIESLASRGPDDYGTETPDPDYTTRLTTPLTRVWEE